MHPFDECIGVEVPVLNKAQRQIYFPQITTLRGKKVSYIRISYGYLNPSGKKNYKMYTPNTLRGCYLVLKAGNDEIINRLNLSSIIDLMLADNQIRIGKEIDLQKCFIDITDTSILDEKASFYFSFFIENETPKLKPLKSKRIEYLEANFQDLDTKRIYFPDDTRLRNKKITEILFSLSLKNPSGLDCMPYHDKERTAFITLFNNEGKKIVDRLPLDDLYISGVGYSIINFNRIEIDFPTSYIDYINPQPEDVGKSFLFNVVHEI